MWWVCVNDYLGHTYAHLVDWHGNLSCRTCGAQLPVTLITGTSRGIGKHLAARCLMFGDTVIGCSRSIGREDGYCQITQNHFHHQLDVSDPAAVRDMFVQYPKIDRLINCAGIASMNHSMLTPIGKVRQIFEVNVIAPYLMAQEAIRKGCTRIVNFSSVAAPLNLEGESAYAASKAALESLTRIWAKEFAPFSCTVNAVGPGPTDTDLIRGIPSEKMQALLSRQAIKQKTEMKDIANVVDFFLNPLSSMVTGQVIYLGGVS